MIVKVIESEQNPQSPIDHPKDPTLHGSPQEPCGLVQSCIELFQVHGHCVAVLCLAFASPQHKEYGRNCERFRKGSEGPKFGNCMHLCGYGSYDM